MKLFVDRLIIIVCITLEFLSAVNSSQSFLYEKMNYFGLGRRIIPDYRRRMKMKAANEYPEPLPSSSISPVRSTSQTLYQGRRRPNDTRVFRKHFEYDASTGTGHRVFCEGMFDCIITFLAVETEGGIPILLRGGAGYHYFVAVARAKPWDPLKGTIRAYCMNRTNQYQNTFPAELNI